jgi:benzodiazapine receptor
MSLKKLLHSIFFVLLCESAGLVGTIATIPAIPTWYAALEKPAFNPPPAVFGPVWTVLYLLMGIAAFLVYEKGWKHKQVRVAMILFGMQLVLNTFWSLIFFGLHAPIPAFAEIMLLFGFIILTMRAFFRVRREAGWLLLPYLLWVGFASILNLAIVVLN